jgi:hypothetical protein
VILSAGLWEVPPLGNQKPTARQQAFEAPQGMAIAARQRAISVLFQNSKNDSLKKRKKHIKNRMKKPCFFQSSNQSIELVKIENINLELGFQD